MIKNKNTKISENVQNALNDLNDHEIQRIKEKYSKKSFNILKNRKNKRLLLEEVGNILNNREIERKRTERRLELEQRKEVILDTIEKTKNHFFGKPKLYSIICATILTLITGFALFNKWQSTIKDIKFAFSDEEKLVGDYIDLNYLVDPDTADYDDDEISIIFNNNDLVEYDEQSNKYNCIKDGELVVKLIYGNKEYDTKRISIKPVLVSKLYLPDIEIGRGNDLILEPIIEPSNATNKNYTISVDDANIASIQGNIIYGVSLGETILHLKSEDGFAYDVNVDVIDIEPNSISISGIKDRYIIGDEDSALVEYSPKETTLKDVAWYSSDQRIVAIDQQGNIIAKEKGAVTITAVYNEEVKSNKEIIVDYPLPAEIAITNISNTITVGQSTQLYAAITPNKVSDNSINWTSSDSSVAEIDERGIVKGVKEGKATITAKTANGKTTTFIMLIQAAPVITRSNAPAPVTTNGTQSNAASYVLNVKTYKFHRPTCRKLPTTNRQDSYATREEIISWGYEPCGICHP